MVMLMDSPAIRLMYTGTSQTPCLVIDFDNDKRGVISILVEDCSFSSFIRYKSGEVAVIPEATGFLTDLSSIWWNSLGREKASP